MSEKKEGERKRELRTLLQRERERENSEIYYRERERENSELYYRERTQNLITERDRERQRQRDSGEVGAGRRRKASEVRLSEFMLLVAGHRARRSSIVFQLAASKDERDVNRSARARPSVQSGSADNSTTHSRD